MFRSLPLFFAVCLPLFTGPSIFAFDHQHPQLGQLLSSAVHLQNNQSQVDYRWLKIHQNELQSYLDQLSAVRLSEYQHWSEPEQLAFLINSYNSFTLSLILSQYPDLSSIKELGSWLSSPWKQEFFSLLGQKRNLDWIEHKQLRAQFKEPRIHFAIVCASKGCPPLSPIPYQPALLDRQLEQATQRFLSDPSRNRYEPKSRTLYLSKIFDWFAEDFQSQAGSVPRFVAPWMGANQAQQTELATDKIQIQFLDYDWSLNQTAP